jgi:hypothetical protein
VLNFIFFASSDLFLRLCVKLKPLLKSQFRAKAQRATKAAKFNVGHYRLLVVGQFEEWHGRLAREITRKMRVPPQTDPLPGYLVD